MHAVKKVEIIISEYYQPSLLNLLQDLGVHDYSIIPNLTGAGGRGLQTGGGLNEEFNNCMVMIACEEILFNRIIEPVREMLKKNGGICLVTEAAWVAH